MKKSQTSAGSIAVFVILLALFMVLYLLFLPPKDRANLLGENKTSEDTNGNNGGTTASGNVLLTQSLGLLKPFEKETSTHEIDSVQLFLKDEPMTEDLATSISVSKSMFSTETKQLRFNIDDLTNLNKVTLFFLVTQAKGELIIELNNIEIFNGKASGLQDVTLPLGVLKESNTLTFRVSSASFFSKNVYSLNNIKLRESFELTNTKELRSFVLTASETGDADLNFFVFCNSAPIGSRLRIFANDEEVFNNVISCISTEKTVEINADDLKEGTNSLLFEIDKGDFLLNDIELKVKLEEGGGKTYKFSLTEKQLNALLDGGDEIKLLMNFNDDKQKSATININGNEFTLDTKDLDYERFITSLVKEGNNFIRITPSNEFTVDLLEVKII